MSSIPGIQIGDVLAGKYEVVDVIGQGGMGFVLQAVHRGLGRPVALKVLRKDPDHAAELSARFEREARAAARLQSRHAVSIADVDYTDDGTPFIVMELLRGHDLERELARAGRLDVRTAVTYVLQACTAMAEAHALSIIHRDLKPQNLFLTQSGDKPTIKVLDFGISKIGDESGKNITQTASALGTPLYMSPEQIRSSKHVDEQTDIWSLGVILYELLAGHPPFDAESPTAIVAAITADEPAALSLVRTDVPQALSDAVMKALAKRKVDRYPNVAALAAALAPFGEPGAFVAPLEHGAEAPLESCQAVTERSTKRQTASSWETTRFVRASRTTKAAVIGAAAALALAAGIAIVATRDDEASPPVAAVAEEKEPVAAAAPPPVAVADTPTAPPAASSAASAEPVSRPPSKASRPSAVPPSRPVRPEPTAPATPPPRL